MNYDVIALACEQLSYRDKLRLAQLLIQAARKEEEEANPENRAKSAGQTEKKDPNNKKEANSNDIEYVIERLRKLKPAKKASIINSIKAMYQFQGGISDSDIERIISLLQKKKYINIENNKVTFN
jgi:hypothetical protein